MTPFWARSLSSRDVYEGHVCPVYFGGHLVGAGVCEFPRRAVAFSGILAAVSTECGLPRPTCAAPLLVLDGLDDALAGGGAGGEEAGEDPDNEAGEKGSEGGDSRVVEVDLEAPGAGAEDEEVA